MKLLFRRGNPAVPGLGIWRPLADKLGIVAEIPRRDAAQRRALTEAGFTLLEMLVVLVIVGLLVGLVAPKVFGQLSDARVKTAKIQIQSFENGLDLFYLDNGRYPTSEEGLTALYTKPSSATNWNGPYLRGNGTPKDPWNTPYLYRSPGQGRPYEITSLGSGGHEGGTDSATAINSWQQ
jgi:general secretion pathway protein G